MVGKKLLLTIAGVTLLAGTSYAQQRHETPTHPVIHSPGSPGPRGPTPFERKVNPTWHDFQHHESDVRVHPRRNGNSFLPMPNSWRGDVHNFDRDRWGRGEWHHERHNGRFGWWWVVGPEWYFFDAPIYPYPDSFVPPGEEFGWWYWCEDYQEYYPYVTDCPSGWEPVLPRD
ncbi:MAG TPA: hypothetical protein VLW75_09610 [Rhizomicrobium sp.]|nr:hypothetical protein [Rhizomicrobium sp.]